jgi:hypothetical protein
VSVKSPDELLAFVKDEERIFIYLSSLCFQGFASYILEGSAPELSSLTANRNAIREYSLTLP